MQHAINEVDVYTTMGECSVTSMNAIGVSAVGSKQRCPHVQERERESKGSYIKSAVQFSQQ